MRALVILLTLTCLLPSSVLAMSCGEEIRVGQWFPRKELTPELLRGLVARQVSVADVRETHEGFLLAATMNEDEIVLRLLVSDETVETFNFSRTLKRATPRITVKSDLPEMVAVDDAKYESRRYEIRADAGLIKRLRDKNLPDRPAKIIYVESHSHVLRELEGRLELPDPEEQVMASMTGKALCLRVITAGGTRTVESRRVVRLYL